jgi:hypothetical protein
MSDLGTKPTYLVVMGWKADIIGSF